MKTDILFSLTGDVRRNSRALKQIRVMASLGASVTVLMPAQKIEVIDFEDKVRLFTLPRAPGDGPRFFWRHHQIMRKAALDISAKVYHASDLYTLPALSAAARKWKGKLAYDARELYPYVASTAGRPHVHFFWKTVEGRYIRRADAVFTVSKSIADKMVETYGIPRPLVLYNVPPRQHPSASDFLRKALELDEGTVILLHQGNMQKHRGCDLLIEAMLSVEGAVLVFLGDGALKPTLQARVQEQGLASKIFFLDAVPPDELLNITASADIGITLLEDTCLNHRFALPNKLFEYLMAGLPVLASDLPEIRRVINNFNVGRVVDPNDLSALAITIQQMVDDPQSRRRWRFLSGKVFDIYNWEKASQLFISTYQSLLMPRLS